MISATVLLCDCCRVIFYDGVTVVFSELWGYAPGRFFLLGMGLLWVIMSSSGAIIGM